MNTEEIVTTETEQQMTEMFEQHLKNMEAESKPLTTKDAHQYVKSILGARQSKDFKDVRKVWNSIGKRKFKRSDYETIIRPVINEDFQMVHDTLAKLGTAKTKGEYKKLFKLPRPVVPVAYKLWKVEAAKIAFPLFNQKFVKKGNTLTNTVAIAR